MTAERRKPPPPERLEDIDSPKMEIGRFYDCDPPISITSGAFKRIRCDSRFPRSSSYPDTYMVSGVPVGGSEAKRFPLQFTDTGIRVTPASEQEFLYATPTTAPKPRSD